VPSGRTRTDSAPGWPGATWRRRSTSCWPPTKRRRTLTTRVDELRAEQNKASKAIGGAQGEEKQQLIAEVARVSAELKELEPQLATAEGELNALLAATPNVPHESAPDGFTDEDAVEVRRHLEPTAVRLRASRPRGARGVAGRARHRAWVRARAVRGSSTCWAIWCSCSSR
jgi:seryl-tRNA synthetase